MNARPYVRRRPRREPRPMSAQSAAAIVLAALALAALARADVARTDTAASNATSPAGSLAARDLPATLSATGVFEDLARLEPARGSIAYDVAVALWSDGAAKRRWIALPNDAGGERARIGWSERGPWRFPAGTVFVKHFEDASGPSVAPIETRVLVVEASGAVRGATYRWRLDGTDADLVRDRATATTVGPDGESRTWTLPGVADCATCHATAAGSVLGVVTRQLRATGDLERWNALGMFDRELTASEIESAPALARRDDETASLEHRARSVLDVECAACHRPGGATADFDARFETPLENQGIVGARARIDLGIDRARIVAPNDPSRSVLVRRMQALGGLAMPPLGHARADERSIALLSRWIATLPGPRVLEAPTITPDGGDHAGDVLATLSHGDPLATLRYTLDGSAPDARSAAYERPLRITRSTTVRVRAYRPGFDCSVETHATFVVQEARR